MKKLLAVCACLIGCTVMAAQPINAVLVVQNHVGKAFDRPLTSLADRFSAAISGDLFNVIDPGDVIGDKQNVGPSGEAMPQASATRLAELCGAPAAITVSLDSYSVISTGSPVLLKQRTATVTVQAKSVMTGAAVRGVTRKFVSQKYRLADFEANADTIYDDLVQQAVTSLSKEFLAQAAAVAWKVPVAQKIVVGFGCNVAGADVAIDGVSYGLAGGVGAAPLKVKVLPGVHNLKVSFPFKTVYETRANLQSNSTFMVVLQENAEGRAQREHDAYLALLFDRIAKSGATDDLVREIRARGYANYLSASCHRIEGMPQTISLTQAQLPDPGLSGNAAPGPATTIKSTGELMKEAKEVIK